MRIIQSYVVILMFIVLQIQQHYQIVLANFITTYNRNNKEINYNDNSNNNMARNLNIDNNTTSQLVNSNLNDEYVVVNQNECFNSRKLISCFKYKISKVIWSIATNRFNYFQNENSKSINNLNVDTSHNNGNNNNKKIVMKMNFIHLLEPSTDELFSDARSFEDDNEFTKAWKFFKRATQTFLQQHAIQFPLNGASGVRVDIMERSFTDFAYNARGDKKKRKWLIILPLIILMKIAHLKMTVVPLLLGIAGLQLLTFAGGAYIVHYLKRNTLCKIHPHLVHTHSHVWDSEPEYSTFVGSSHSHGPPIHQDHYSYGNDWSSGKAYKGYNYLDTISQPI